MLRTMMKSKILRATVTRADLHHVGSVTVYEDLLDANHRVLSTGSDPVDVPPGHGLHGGDLVAVR